jgi:hypothetical protein
MNIQEIKKQAIRLKPNKYEISILKLHKSNGNNFNLTMYFNTSNEFVLTKGIIANEKQNHTILFKSKDYNNIIDYLIQCTNG